MARWARTMIRFRWAVFAAWVILFLVAGIASSGLSDLLTNRFALPGAESEKAADILKDRFGQKPEGSFTLVVTAPDGKAAALLPQVRAAGARAANELPTAQLASVRAVSPDVATATIVSKLQTADAKVHTEAMRNAAGSIPG